MKVKCPYCGFKNNLHRHQEPGRDLMLCELEEGGCDKYFVINVVVKREVATAKIEGEEK